MTVPQKTYTNLGDFFVNESFEMGVVLIGDNGCLKSRFAKPDKCTVHLFAAFSRG
jgi:hypothetical protein